MLATWEETVSVSAQPSRPTQQPVMTPDPASNGELPKSVVSGLIHVFYEEICKRLKVFSSLISHGIAFVILNPHVSFYHEGVSPGSPVSSSWILLMFLSVLSSAIFCDYYNSDGNCEWHYDSCGKPCIKTCKNPTGESYNQFPSLEGTNYMQVVLI